MGGCQIGKAAIHLEFPHERLRIELAEENGQYGAVELDDPEQVLDVLPSSERTLEVSP